MLRHLRVVWLVVCLISVASLFGSGELFADGFVEDFTTLYYCNELYTTAWWDTAAGEVKLPPFEITLVGTCLTDGVQDVAIAGDYAYVADGYYFHAVDISDPADPVPVGKYNTRGYAYSAAISGDYAYVADTGVGLTVVDISVPTSPALAGSCDTFSDTYAVTVSGDYAYVAGFTAGILAIDISDPTNPVATAAYDTPGAAQGVAVSGDYAYVADRGSGLLVIDISDPGDPPLTLAGSYDTPGWSFDVKISGDHAYVADYHGGLQVIDISDPTNPTLAGSYATPGYARAVAVTGDYAYVADYGGGVQVIDITDPTNPTLFDTYEALETAVGIALSGTYACVADYDSGLHVIDIADLCGPVFAGRCTDPSSSQGIAISGDYAYVTDYHEGLHVIDISDPATPIPAGNYDTSGHPLGIALSGDYAYVADSEPGLVVIDISDPATPTLAGSYNTPGTAQDVAVSGDYAYVADGATGGLQVIDISDPTTPTSAGSCDPYASCRGIAVSGDYAYVADGATGGLRVVDISDPTTPTPVGSYDTPGVSFDIVVSGDYAYVADFNRGLHVIDISDPTSPAFAGSLGVTGMCRVSGVAISGDYACLIGSDPLLQVVDISDPTSPLLIETTNPLFFGADVAISGDCVYAATTYELRVFELFQRLYDAQSNTARSKWIPDTGELISAARISAVYSDSVRWEMTIDGGMNWLELLPGERYRGFPAPGNDPGWRSYHYYAGDDMNAVCSNLEIEWLYETPAVESIVDVPNDQGRQLSLSWAASGYDAVGSVTPIIEYAVYRRIDPDLTEPPGERGSVRLGAGAEPLYPPGDWYFITAVPADIEEEYAVVVPTLADSTIAEGMYYTSFFVRARTATPGFYFDSDPDSGYSLDNLAPAPPPNLRMESATEVAWDECPDEDFDYFSVYGSAAGALDSTATLVGHTSGTMMDITEDTYHYYHVTATDFSGNEGAASSVENEYAGVSLKRDLPERFALKQNCPNPFESTTRIAFDLPEPRAVRLEVVDVQGRVVRVLTDEAWSAGRHSLVWSGETASGEIVGPGIYFMRINAGEFTATRKILLMR